MRILIYFLLRLLDLMNFVENLLRNYPYVRVHPDKRVFVEQVIQNLTRDGRKLLHIITDFDFTLTKYEKNGQHLPSTFAVIEGDSRVQVSSSSLDCFSFSIIDHSLRFSYLMDR